MKMEKVIVIDARKCTGCKTCEMVCSFSNEQAFSRHKARIRNFGDLRNAFFASITCMQCENPPCAKVCPSGALFKQGGTVKVDGPRCIGCKLCILACPFGNLHLDGEKGTSFKCELCSGHPECVAYCPTGALQYQEIYTPEIEKRKDLFDKLKEVYFQSETS
jgi:anaerobic carbon-monoxide dehydrogenase iron sulfur subunit